MIPISNTNLAGAESEYLENCIHENWISSYGKYNSKFENEFSKYLNVSNSLCCANGTVALHLALLSLNLKPGDEIIVPSFTFIATVNSILYCNCKPVFADIDPDTWCINPEDMERKITNKTKAVLVVHIYGNPCDMGKIINITKKNNLFLIEDCAEALGASFDGQKVGSLSDVSTFSFYGNKIITSGEGGMVCTNSNKIMDRIKLLRDHGMSKKIRYYHEILGYNYRMTNLQASIGVAQLEKIDYFLDERKKIFENYNLLLKAIKFVKLPFQGTDIQYPVNWLYTILVKNKKQRAALIEHLKMNGIDTRPVFIPCHKMPYINFKVKLPVTENISRRGLSLPTFVGLKEKQIEYISHCIKKFFENRH